MFWRPHAATLQLLFLCIGTSVRYCYGFMLSTSRIQPLRCDLSMVIVVPEKDRRLDFNFIGKIAFSLVPLSPESLGRRKTIFTEVVPGKVWTLDQVQGVINVNVPVRSTIIRLKDGGLFINNPVAPTIECIEYVRALEAEHGNVKYIVLSSLAIEHKGTSGVFSRYFPESVIYVQPGQYTFPINLPTALFYPFGKIIKEIPDSSSDAPWGEEIDHQVLGPLKPPGVGGFGETAFFHKETKTLLVTDTIIRVDDEPPAIIQEDPRSLIYHSRDNMSDIVDDTPENRRKGWRRMVLFGLFFQPAGIFILDTFVALKMLDQVTPEMKKLGEGALPDGGFYPWQWERDDRKYFKAIQGGLLVAPILQKLILNREPERVLAWVNKVSEWPITRIIPCHFANDIKASGSDFKKAFEFLQEPEVTNPLSNFIAAFDSRISKNTCPVGDKDDRKFLEDISVTLTAQGVLFPEAPLVAR